MTEPLERLEAELIPPDRTEAAFFIGKIGSRELVEVTVPFITAPDGTVGIAASQLKKLANQTEGDEIIWIRADGNPDVGITEKASKIEPTVLADGRLVIDHEGKQVIVDGEETHFTSTQYQILEFLASQPGRVFDRTQILDACWGDHDYRNDKIVDVQIASMRKELGPDLRKLLGTRRNFGFFVTTELDQQQRTS